MQIWFAIAVSSPRVGFIYAEVVTMDMVDMLVGKIIRTDLCRAGDRTQDVRLRKILWLTTGTIKT